MLLFDFARCSELVPCPSDLSDILRCLAQFCSRMLGCVLSDISVGLIINYGKWGTGINLWWTRCSAVAIREMKWVRNGKRGGGCYETGSVRWEKQKMRTELETSWNSSCSKSLAKEWPISIPLSIFYSIRINSRIIHRLQLRIPQI